MGYLREILWYMFLPATIVISYYAVLLALKWFHKTIENN